MASPVSGDHPYRVETRTRGMHEACLVASTVVGAPPTANVTGQRKVGSVIRLRSDITLLAWIWHTLDSVTPRTSPTSARVRPSK